jgi:hypothetical protein
MRRLVIDKRITQRALRQQQRRRVALDRVWLAFSVARLVRESLRKRVFHLRQRLAVVQYVEFGTNLFPSKRRVTSKQLLCPRHLNAKKKKKKRLKFVETITHTLTYRFKKFKIFDYIQKGRVLQHGLVSAITIVHARWSQMMRQFAQLEHHGSLEQSPNPLSRCERL